MREWRTTISGLAVIVGGIFLLAHAANVESRAMGGTLIVAGIGLVKAKDA